MSDLTRPLVTDALQIRPFTVSKPDGDRVEFKGEQDFVIAYLNLYVDYFEPDGSYDESLYMSSQETINEFIKRVELEFEVTVPQKHIDALLAQEREFQNLLTGAWNEDFDIIDPDGEGFGDPEDDDYYDPNYCEQCGDYSSSVINVAFFPGGDKYDSWIKYTPSESCFGAPPATQGRVADTVDAVLAELNGYVKYHQHPRLVGIIEQVESLRGV